jgi:hypothetical protein
VAGDGTARTISDLLRWGARRAPEEEVVVPVVRAEAPVLPSIALPRFLAALSGRVKPSLVDLGPVVGSNITFFGERLGCKIFIEDLFLELGRLERRHELAALPAFLEEQFAGREASVDGVLCWDLFDHLDRPSAKVLATQLVRTVKPGGAVLGFFGTTERARAHYTKFVIVDDGKLRHRAYAAPEGQTRVFLTRDILRMFEGLEVVEQFLLKSKTREFLFRKPS